MRTLLRAAGFAMALLSAAPSFAAPPSIGTNPPSGWINPMVQAPNGGWNPWPIDGTGYPEVDCITGCGGGGGGSNPAAGTTGAAVPGSASYTAYGSGGNLVPVDTTHYLPVQDYLLDALISGGALNINVVGTPTVNATGTVSVSNFPATQPISGTVTATPKVGTVTIAGCTVGVSSAQCFAATSMNAMFVENNSATATVACSDGGTATLNSNGSIQFGPGASMLFGAGGVAPPTAAWNCISSAASTPLYVRYN